MAEALNYPAGWDETIAALPGANILQTSEWAAIKAAYGWEPRAMLWNDADGKTLAAASILKRPLRLGGFSARLSVLYVPRGPLMDWSDRQLRERVLEDLKALARKEGAIFLKIDPEVVLGCGAPESGRDSRDPAGSEVEAALKDKGWRYSGEQIQFRNTVMLDLRAGEAEWLARMKPKTRYNLRLAQKKGLAVRRGVEADFGLLYRMYAETSVRDGFVIRPEGYYREVWQTFTRRGMCIPLIAEVEGDPVAAVMLFVYAGRAWYIYGMSRDVHRDKMPNYLLQWEAMRAARAAGALSYDLWGAPDEFIETDPLWGVYRFKEGLGGQVVRTLGAWDYAANRPVYSLYTQILPRLLDVLRRRGKERTRREVAA